MLTRVQELRHVALLQEQEDLVVEVERCISKRESISMKVSVFCLCVLILRAHGCVAGKNNAKEV